MDLNVVVICGRLAAEPETRIFDGGATLVRYLVATRSETPRPRVDVVPVVQWDADEPTTALERGDGVCVTGSVQRRFWSDDRNRRSRIEVVAHYVQKREDDEPEQEAQSMVEQTMQV